MICPRCGCRNELVEVRKPNKKVYVYCGNCGNLIKKRKVVKESEFYRKLEPFEFK